MANQVKMSTDAGQSVLAFYAADAGAELCLYQARQISGACSVEGGSFFGTIDNGATFIAQRIDSTTIHSTGSFGKASRRIELTW
jgi:hypothetical protein